MDSTTPGLAEALLDTLEDLEDLDDVPSVIWRLVADETLPNALPGEILAGAYRCCPNRSPHFCALSLCRSSQGWSALKNSRAKTEWESLEGLNSYPCSTQPHQEPAKRLAQ
jgi:hypothetical protein